jgi:hypothetical protein
MSDNQTAPLLPHPRRRGRAIKAAALSFMDNHLPAHELKAMRAFQAAVVAGKQWGTRMIVSMQRLEERGLVKSIHLNGRIHDFIMTDAGWVWSATHRGKTP